MQIAITCRGNNQSTKYQRSWSLQMNYIWEMSWRDQLTAVTPSLSPAVSATGTLSGPPAPDPWRHLCVPRVYWRRHEPPHQSRWRSEVGHGDSPFQCWSSGACASPDSRGTVTMGSATGWDGWDTSHPIFLLFNTTPMDVTWEKSTPEGLRPPQYSEDGGAPD